MSDLRIEERRYLSFMLRITGERSFSCTNGGMASVSCLVCPAMILAPCVFLLVGNCVVYCTIYYSSAVKRLARFQQLFTYIFYIRGSD